MKSVLCFLARFGTMLLTCVLGVGAFAQQSVDADHIAATSAATTDTHTTPKLDAHSTQPAPDSYLIGIEDVLNVNVWKEPEISRVVPVRPDGKISLPLLGDIQASGMTPRTLQSEIANALHAFISNPEVTVIVQEVKSRKFNIVGEVAKPGSYPLSDPMTVLDAIAVGGGLKDFAKGSRIYVLRANATGGQAKLPFDYRNVIKGKKLSENVNLLPGDTVVVP